MPTVIDKALDFIGGMNTSAPTPHSMDESTAKGMFNYLKKLGVPMNSRDIIARGEQEGWHPEFINKVAGWADKIESTDRVVIKNPEYFTSYMKDELRARVNVEFDPAS